ncbi:MAG: type II toxin-antitoxin system YafQ family toxin [Bryobacteraceae bacterium]|jgi:mRNA interferase YafQ
MALARTTTAFERDLKRAGRQGKDLDKLESVINLLQEQQPLPGRCRPHPLRVAWIGHWDCQIEPDWLLL